MNERLVFSRVDTLRRLFRRAHCGAVPSELSSSAGLKRARRFGLFMVCVAVILSLPERPSVGSHTALQRDPLAEVRRLAWLNNWIDAAGVLKQLEAEDGLPDQEPIRTFASAVRIRGNIESLPLPAAASDVENLLNTNSGRTIIDLRLQLLAIKGDIEFQYDLLAAQKDWEQVKEIAESHGMSAWASRAEGELGTIDFLNGQIYRAVRRVSRALLKAELSHDVAAQIRYRTALGEGLNEFGRKADAIRFFDKALALAAESPGAYFPFTAYLGKARLFAGGDRREEGTRMLQAGLAEAKTKGLRVREARILAVLGEIALDHKEFEEANRWLSSAADVARGDGLDRIESEAASTLASLLLNEGDLARAATYAQRSVEATRRAQDLYHLPPALAVSAEIEARRGRITQAEKLFIEATDVVDGLLRDFPRSRPRNTLIATMGRVFQGHVDLALHGFHNPRKAFYVLESAKARGLADRLQHPQRRVEASFPWDPQPAKEVAVVQKDLTEEDNSTRRRDLLDHLWELEQRSFRLDDAEIVGAGAPRSRPVELEKLQGRLFGKELVLEYLLGPSHSFVLAIASDRVASYELAPRAEIESAITAHLAAVKTGRDTSTAAQALYRLLLQPVEPLARKARLVVVPDSTLHLVPFGALIDSNGQFLDETHIVSYAPSSTVYYLLSKPWHRDSHGAFLGIGGIPYGSRAPSAVGRPWRALNLFNAQARPHWSPLPQSLTEVKDVAATQIGPTKLLIASDATEANFRNLNLPAFRILHLALHSTIDQEFPDRSALVLSSNPSVKDDGLLQAREILSLHLNADLVTLSACDGGTGTIEGIAGINSLVEAFLMAGARSVVATVWDADDTFTASLMRRFYAHLRQGFDKAEALALAKRDLLKRNGPDALPFYWAGFRIVGDAHGRIAGAQHE